MNDATGFLFGEPEDAAIGNAIESDGYDQSVAAHKMDNRLALIRASAGAGKTYRLTGRFIALLVLGIEPSDILATTFTRKAAGEILGRVLLRVAEAAVDAKKAKELNQAVAAEKLGADVAWSPAMYATLLSKLVRGLDRLAIGTIDGFFNRCVTAFALELGVPSHVQLTDDASAWAKDLRGQAIDQWLDEAAEEDMDTLLALLKRIHFDGQRQSVAGSLDRLLSGGMDGLYDTYRQARDANQWPSLKGLQPLEPEKVKAAVQRLAEGQPLLPVTGKGTPNKTWEKGFHVALAAAQAGDWEAFLKAGPTMRAAQREPYARAEADEDLAERFAILVEHAQGVLVQQINFQTQSTFEMLTHFAKRFEPICRDQQVLFYADLTDLLVRKLPELGETAQSLAFRLDSQVQHLLIDEFQDTSIDQHRVLWPLIDDVAQGVDEGRTFFCVGDAKQSIYGWRGGRVELFDAIETDLAGFDLKVDQIATSYRSSQVVLDFCNAVFGSLKGLVKPDALAEGDPSARFGEMYETHHAARDLPGFVTVQTTAVGGDDADGFGADDPDTDDDGQAVSEDPHDAAVAEHVQALLAKAKPAGGMHVAILTRSNQEAANCLRSLRKRGIPASGEGGAALADHPAVACVLACFTLADHPGDLVAAKQVFASPVNAWLGMSSASRRAADAASATLRQALLDEGVAGLVAKLAGLIEPTLKQSPLDTNKAGGALLADSHSDVHPDPTGGIRRLQQLLAFAEAQVVPSLLRPSRFVQAVQTARVSDPEAAAVTVMTIHKSKGLEFDHVVLPTLAKRPQNFTPTMLEDRQPETGPIQGVYRAGTKDIRAVIPKLEDLYNQAKARSGFEDWCTLYVAMTRAKHAVSVLLRPAKEGRNFASGSHAERLAIALDLQTVDMPGQVLWESGDPDWLLKLGKTGAFEAVSNANETLETLRWSLPKGKGRLPRTLSPSSMGQAQSVLADDLFSSLNQNAGAQFGEAVHQAMEAIGFVDDPGFDAIERLDGFGPSVVQVVTKALANPHIEALLSRRGAHVVKHEHSFSYQALGREQGAASLQKQSLGSTSGGGLVRGQMDRVVGWQDGQGRWVKAQVLDFKTDRAKQADGTVVGLADLVAKYEEQMLTYRMAVSRLWDVPLADVETVLVWITQGQSATVHAWGDA